MRDFSTIAAPLNDLATFFQHSHEQINSCTATPIFGFGKSFMLECDASEIRIGGVLLQEGKPIVYFSEN
jgi:hypothetical protein